MRLNDVNIQMTLTIPFDTPDKNGNIYSKEAIKNAINDFNTKLPIIYRDNDKCKYGIIIGETEDKTCFALCDNEHKVYKITVNGKLHSGGTECVINKIEDNIIKSLEIVSVGISL